MAGLVPAIHAFSRGQKGVDARHKGGHDVIRRDGRPYELALSTVTARRFCDQQEMSSHTATGRSLP